MFFFGVGGALSNKNMFEQCVASQIGATVFFENPIKDHTVSFCLQGGYSIQLPNVSRVDPSVELGLARSPRKKIMTTGYGKNMLLMLCHLMNISM